MATTVSFVNASALTLLTATPLSTRSQWRAQISSTPSYRISTTVCMDAKRAKPSPDSKSAQLPPPARLVDSEQQLDPDQQQDLDQQDPSDHDPLLVDPDDDEIIQWAGNDDEPPNDDSFDQIILGSNDQTTAGLPDDDPLLIDPAFENAEDDGDEDDEDEDDDEDDDDEDDDLDARANGDDFDDDISIRTLDKSRRRVSPRRMTLDADAEDDDEDDEENILEPIAEELEPVFDDSEDAGLAVSDDLPAEAQTEAPPVGDDEQIPESFDEETEEEIQSAADILSSSGLLGLGVEGGKRADISAVKEFAMGRKSAVSELELEGEFDDGALPLSLDEEDEEDDEEGKGVVADYPDLDEEEDDAFTLTSQSSFGRVWELNEDTYVTITEPGQSYAYELDEEDEEDQEMASVRRGKQGGWSGGLASYPADSLPKGSKEWIARRSYELMTGATPVEMFRWTRNHKGPPSAISGLYPNDPPPPTALGKTTLKFSSPSTEASIIGKDTSGAFIPTDTTRSKDEPDVLQNPLERAIKFPCIYKFKVEGSGDSFPSSLRETVEEVLGREMPELELEVEPAGRYERVVIPVKVESAQQVTILYDALRSNPSVKFSFG